MHNIYIAYGSKYVTEMSKIDSKDRKIIKILQSDITMTQEKIGKQLGLSRPAIQKRIKNLQDKGIIKYTLQVNERKLGKQIAAFILVTLRRAGRVWNFTYEELMNRMDELEIHEFHHLTGAEDVILKMKTKNINTLEANLMKITRMRGVSRTRTLICLSSVEGKEVSTIPNSSSEPTSEDILWNLM